MPDVYDNSPLAYVGHTVAFSCLLLDAAQRHLGNTAKSSSPSVTGRVVGAVVSLGDYVAPAILVDTGSGSAEFYALSDIAGLAILR